MRKLQFFSSLIACTIALLATACGKDTVADSVSREKDRERESAEAVTADSQSVAGFYSGVGTTLESDSYDIQAYIDVALANRDGTLVPQPSIVGSFTTMNRTRSNSRGAPMKLVFPFSNGAYDSTKGRLAITISGLSGSPAILINCQVINNVRMNCLWHSLISDLHFKFNLVKQRQ
jgi:hypothetical protein